MAPRPAGPPAVRRPPHRARTRQPRLQVPPTFPFITLSCPSTAAPLQPIHAVCSLCKHLSTYQESQDCPTTPHTSIPEVLLGLQSGVAFISADECCRKGCVLTRGCVVDDVQGVAAFRLGASAAGGPRAAAAVRRQHLRDHDHAVRALAAAAPRASARRRDASALPRVRHPGAPAPSFALAPSLRLSGVIPTPCMQWEPFSKSAGTASAEIVGRRAGMSKRSWQVISQQRVSASQRNRVSLLADC